MSCVFCGLEFPVFIFYFTDLDLYMCLHTVLIIVAYYPLISYRLDPTSHQSSFSQCSYYCMLISILILALICQAKKKKKFLCAFSLELLPIYRQIEGAYLPLRNSPNIIAGNFVPPNTNDVIHGSTRAFIFHISPITR